MAVPVILPVIAWAICIAALAAYTAVVAREITYVTLADGRKTERRLPLVFRLLLPFAPNFNKVVYSTRFAARRDKIGRMLVSAGMEGLLSDGEFLALQLIMPIVFGVVGSLAAVTLARAMPGSFFSDNAPFIAFASVAIGFLYPGLWLRRTLKRRHLEIMKALPFVLDLLTLSVEAGMDFMSALQRNCERRRLDALNEELIRMLREIQVGTPRRIAFRNLSVRTGQPDLVSVAHALIQADELGVSIGSILRIQSEQLRARRFDRAEKLANEAPVKMLGPLLICIFPAVFVILLGPVLLQAAKSIF